MKYQVFVRIALYGLPENEGKLADQLSYIAPGLARAISISCRRRCMFDGGRRIFADPPFHLLVDWQQRRGPCAKLAKVQV